MTFMIKTIYRASPSKLSPWSLFSPGAVFSLHKVQNLDQKVWVNSNNMYMKHKYGFCTKQLSLYVITFECSYSLLSYPNPEPFTDLQMRPYRTDDFITKLFYETSRFSAFNLQWVVKAHVNDHQKNPNLSLTRGLSYQLVSFNLGLIFLLFYKVVWYRIS